MIGGHPGGLSLTKRLLALTGKEEGTGENLLDLGAGTGESVRWLNTLGYEAVGIDLCPKGERVFVQDMRNLQFPGEHFSLCLAECSVSVCGDGKKALQEAARVLKPGGSLLLSDVSFHKKDAPELSFQESRTKENWKKNFQESGFVMKKLVDETELWKTFFLESLWNGDAEEGCLEFFQKAGKYQCGYFLAWLVKEGSADGFV